MGWSCRITSDKEITSEELEVILKNAPQELQSPLGFNKQAWGWLMATDVDIPQKNEVRIGGSCSMSGHLADPMRNYLKKELKKLGHKIRSTKPR